MIRRVFLRKACVPLWLFFFAITSCNKPSAPVQKAGGVPQTRATVVTIQTTVQPENKTFTHTLTIANNLARSSDELDQWRLFDLKNNRVVYVDDIAKTFRTEPVTAALARRRAAAKAPLPAGVPRASVAGTNQQRSIQGVNATQVVIRAGSYVRELWVGSHGAIPPSLYGMMYATDTVSSPLAGMTAAVDEAIYKLRGFPLAEHAELPVGAKKMVVDRNVVKIETRDVPAALLNVPRDYRDVTPRPAPKK